VDRYSQATITMWVDPRTGIPVKHRQQIHSTVQTANGKGKMVVASADLNTKADSVEQLVDTANGSAFSIDAVRLYVPVGAVLVGLVLLLVGTFTGLPVSGRPAPPPAPRRSDGKFGDPAPRAAGRHRPAARRD
jgi:hypothetical protein